MLIINIKENESIDKALKRFKKKFEKTGVLKELRDRTSFTKPSVRRRGQVIRAAYRQKMYASENYWFFSDLKYIQSSQDFFPGGFFFTLGRHNSAWDG